MSGNSETSESFLFSSDVMVTRNLVSVGFSDSIAVATVAAERTWRCWGVHQLDLIRMVGGKIPSTTYCEKANKYPYKCSGWEKDLSRFSSTQINLMCLGYPVKHNTMVVCLSSGILENTTRCPLDMDFPLPLNNPKADGKEKAWVSNAVIYFPHMS